MARTVLVVDDDPKIVALVRAYLVNAGYDVVTAPDGRQALEAVAAHRPALVVLDLMLPELDGMEVTRRLRETSDVPIVMLTARGATADRVRGLRQGADDYLPKPFAPSELVARVDTVLRRVPEAAIPERRLRCGDLEIDLDRHEVRRSGTPLPLSLVEHRLLVALVEADGRVLTRDQLIDAVSGPHADGVLERSVDVYVGRLRARLGDAADRPA